MPQLIAIKRRGADIAGYALRWGSPDEPDRSPMRDFFTPKTELWLDRFGFPKPILYEHTLKAEAEAMPVVGAWRGAKQDAIGVLLHGTLDEQHPLFLQIARDIDADSVYLSSDSAGHLVRRKPAAKGTHEITRWPLLTASLTKSPAEHRLRPVELYTKAYKHIGAALPALAQEETTMTTMTSQDTNRAARLLAELDRLAEGTQNAISSAVVIARDSAHDAERVLDELHGGNYRRLADAKEAAYKAYLRGAPWPHVAHLANVVVLSPQQVLDCIKAGMSVAEIKTTLIESNGGLGGFLVPSANSERIFARAATVAVVRPRATVDTPGQAGVIAFPSIQGSGDVYPSALRGAWLTETGTATAENPLIGLIKPAINLWRCRVDVSRNLFEDGGARFLSRIEDTIAETLGAEEDRSCLVGSGVGQPLGVFAQDGNGNLLNADVRVTNSGDASAITADGVINMIFSLPGQYRAAPGFAVVCKGATLKAIRGIKDTTGRYVFDELNRTIAGYPVLESEAMPAIAANAYPLGCGDFEGYAIADQSALAVEFFNDSATAATNSVRIFARRRLGGMPAAGYRFAALKVAV
jgi:HK97 family phage major capsid protein